MKLQRREIITIGIGAVIAVGALVYRLGGRSGAAAGGTETISGAMARIDEFARLKHSIEMLSGQLGLQVPASTTGDQETAIMDDIGQRARERGLQLSSLKPAQPTGRGRSTAVKPVQFRLEIAGRFESILEFIYALEHAPTAYVVSEMHLEGSSRAGRMRNLLADMAGAPPPDQSGQDPNQPSGPSNGTVRATMKIQSYLFPVVEPAGSKERSNAS